MAAHPVAKFVSVGKAGGPVFHSARFERSGKAQCAGHVLRPRAIAALVPAGRFEHGEIAHQQRADTDGRAELVPRQHHHVRIGKRNAARALRAIGEEQPARLAHHVQRRGAFVRDHHGAGFRIDRLQRQNAAPLALQRLCQGVQIERAFVNGDHLSIGRGAENRVVLDRARQPPVHLGAAQPDGQRLARAGGEDDLAIPAERGLHPLACILQRGLCLASIAVRGRRVGPAGKASLHRGECFGTRRRRGRVIKINTRFDSVAHGTIAESREIPI